MQHRNKLSFFVLYLQGALMCMSFYIASAREIPLIPYNTDMPEFHTEAVIDPKNTLKNLFSLPHIASFGSDQGCGCGFRHSFFDDGRWTDVVNADNSQTDNSNHSKLLNFIKQTNPNQAIVEILACWNEDYDAIRHQERIALSDILNPGFHFKENVLYTIQLIS